MCRKSEAGERGGREKNLLAPMVSSSLVYTSMHTRFYCSHCMHGCGDCMPVHVGYMQLLVYQILLQMSVVDDCHLHAYLPDSEAIPMLS